MNTSVEFLPGSRAKLSVSVAYEEFDPFVEKAVKKVSETTKIPGFRPGHVPRPILMQHVSEQHLLEEAASLALATFYTKAVLNEKLETIGRPEIHIMKLAPMNPFEFTAEVTLLPAVSIPEKYREAVKGTPPAVEVSDSDVDEVLDTLRKRRATTASIEKAIATGDIAQIDFAITVDGAPLDGGSATDYELEIGSNAFIPGFEEQLVGLKKGDVKEFDLTFPATYHRVELQSKPAHATVTIKDVLAVSLPELNDTFAALVGAFQSMDDLRVKIRENLLAERTEIEMEKFDLALVEQLLAKSSIEVPELLIESELTRMQSELEMRLKEQGMEFDHWLESLKKSKEEVMKDWRPQAIKRVQTGLILREIAKREEVNPSPEEINAEVDKQLLRYQGQKDMVRYFQSEEYKDYARSILKNRMVFEALRTWAAKNA